VLRVATDTEAAAQAAVLARFPSSKCVEQHQGYLRFEVARLDCEPLSSAMGRLADIAAATTALGAELREASLQDIFLTTVGDAAEPDDAAMSEAWG